jgi:hypothetical protein
MERTTDGEQRRVSSKNIKASTEEDQLALDLRSIDILEVASAWSEFGLGDVLAKLSPLPCLCNDQHEANLMKRQTNRVLRGAGGRQVHDKPGVLLVEQT